MKTPPKTTNNEQTQAAAEQPCPVVPDALKAGIESLSGMSLDGVRVNHDTAKPDQLDALAYAQGADIHKAPGQARHLPREAWHVAQQADPNAGESAADEGKR